MPVPFDPHSHQGSEDFLGTISSGASNAELREMCSAGKKQKKTPGSWVGWQEERWIGPRKKDPAVTVLVSQTDGDDVKAF